MATFTKDALADGMAKYGWHIGDYTYGVPIVSTWANSGNLSIGKYCSIASGVKILLGGNHRTDWVTTYPFNRLRKNFRHIEGHPHTKGDVVIGNDVWLGQGCVILSGVTIGDGACVASEALVVKDIPPYTIAGGNPAKVIKKRFSDDQIAKLLSIAWWNWSDCDIEELIPLMLADEVDRFIEKATLVNFNPAS